MIDIKSLEEIEDVSVIVKIWRKCFGNQCFTIRSSDDSSGNVRSNGDY